MTIANSHTHCQVAQTATQAKTWQRVCLFQRTTDRQSTRKTEGQHPQRLGVMAGAVLRMTALW
jgi:hypothetical protein